MVPKQELFPGEKPEDFIFKSTTQTNNPTICTMNDIYGGPTPCYNEDLISNGFAGGFDEQLTGHGLDFTEHV